jgi:hypothetical protein
MSPKKMNQKLEVLSEELNQLSLKATSVSSVLENDGSNYRQWIFDIENFAETIKYGREILRGEKVTLTRTINRENKEEEEEYTYDPREDNMKCAKLKQEILNKMHSDWKLFFMNEKEQYVKVWDILKYLDKVCSRKTAFVRQEKGKAYNSITLEDHDSTMTAMNRLRQTYLEYIEAGGNLKDSDLIIRALNLLQSNQKYDNFRDKICLNEDFDDMRWSEFYDLLLTFESTKENQESGEKAAFNAQPRYRRSNNHKNWNQNQSSYKNQSHYPQRPQYEGRVEKRYNSNNSFDKSRLCYVCGKRGHLAAQCYHRKDNNSRNNNFKDIRSSGRDGTSTQHHAGYAFTIFPSQRKHRLISTNNGYECEDGCDLMIESLFDDKDIEMQSQFALNAIMENRSISPEKYAIIDSGATNLYVNDINLLINPKSIHSSVTTAGGENLKLEAVGTVSIIIGKQPVQIKNSYYCPQFIHNLFGVSKLQEVGITVNFPSKSNSCVLSLDSNNFSIVKRQNGLYLFYLDFKYANLSQKSDFTILEYHYKFGHASFSVMKEMLKSLNIPFDNKELEDICKNCEICIQCKAVSRYLIFRPDKRSQNIGQCVNVDEVGPIVPTSLQGYTYFSLAKDDNCGFSIVVFEKSRGKVIYKLMNFWTTVLKKYKHFQEFVQVRSDGAKAIAKYALDTGLKHFVCLPGVSEENGRAEREVRALCTLTRILLQQSSLPKFLWPEAVSYACYLRNRTYSKTYNGIPYEMFTKEKVDISRFIVFGTKVTVHALKKDRDGKWDIPSLQGYFVGYQEDEQRQLGSSHAIKVFIPPRQLIIRNLIRVHEGEFYQPSSTSSSQGIIPIQVLENEIEMKNDLTEKLNDVLDDIVIESLKAQKQRVTFDEEVQIIQPHQTFQEDIQAEVPQEEIKVTLTEETVPELRSRPTRATHKPKGFYRIPDTTDFDFAGLSTINDDNPLTSYEAHNGPDANQWIESEVKELQNFESKNVFSWVPKSEAQDHQILPIRIVYKKKYDCDGTIKQYKTRITVQGQREANNNICTHAGTVYFCLILMLISLAAMMNLDLVFCDIESAYLNAPTNRTVYVRPTDFAYSYFKKTKDYVWKLNKALYGLKDSARVWKQFLDEKLRSIGFNISKKDSCLFFQHCENGFCFLGIHVDDLTIVSSSKEFRKIIIEKLESIFTIKTNQTNVLGISISRYMHGISISMPNYIERLLKRYQFYNLNPCKTPMESNICIDDFPNQDTTYTKEIIGSLLHLARFTRFDLLFSVHYASLKPNEAVLKRILRYIAGTRDNSFSYKYYSQKAIPTLIGFSDAEWSRDKDAKSTGGYFLTLVDGNLKDDYEMICNAPISVSSKKQTLVTDSSSYAEFVQIYLAAKEIIFLREILKELKFEQTTPTILYVDNAACLQVAYSERNGKNRSKHWNSKFMFVCELIDQGILELRHVPSEHNIADMFTKPLALEKFNHFCKKMNFSEAAQLKGGVAIN